MDALLIGLAIVLPILGILLCIRIWKRWKAPAAAKVLVVLFVMGLGVPFTCGGIATLADMSGLVRHMRF